MSDNLEQSRAEVARLCAYFDGNRESFSAPRRNEAEIRQTLINPLFEALGWDVNNVRRVAPQYREVMLEADQASGTRRSVPDYTFRVGTIARFFVEAKRCFGVSIHDVAEHAFQLRSYGWNARVPLSVLTNFEELAVYDCTVRPKPSDNAAQRRIAYYRSSQYPERWEEIWSVFSRQAMWSGAFDHFAASRRKRGTAEVDVAFLQDIEEWRERLARNIAARNGRLSVEELNRAVQRTIDRIVFLRMAEDRGLEPEGQLLQLCDDNDIYRRFINGLCRRADEKYNSGLFHFRRESGMPDAPDMLTPSLSVDDRVLRPILQRLYFAHGSPYRFDVLPVEILGTVYERFLGKVIRLTPGHQARIDEKPAARKAGGVYYTPDYIVLYIVENTVGLQIKDRSPASLAGANGRQPFRVLDMACGSGSFLLGAYQFLLDHCLRWYSENRPRRWKRAVYRDPSTGQWRLTVEEKKRILTTHIFGVDIDGQAVEVTKLSLLLKVLDGESDESLHLGLLPFSDRALPNLAANIRCGNSLIDRSVFASRLRVGAELGAVSPFDWPTEFPDAFGDSADPGFDCIVGNPPYVRIQFMKEWAPIEVELFKEAYDSARSGSYDLYVVFMERALALLKSRGRLGFICPNKFLNSNYGRAIRAAISTGRHLSHLVHFGAEQVFSGATTYTCLVFLSRRPTRACRVTKVSSIAAWKAGGACTSGTVPAARITGDEWNFSVGEGSALLDRLSGMAPRLSEVAEIYVGLQTSADDVYILDYVSESSRTDRLRSRSLECEWTFEKALLHPLVSGTDVVRYGPLPNRQYILFPYQVAGERASLIRFSSLRDQWPRTAEYLLRNRSRLESRERGAFRDQEWHRLGRNQNLGVQGRVKICVPRLVEHLHASLDRQGDHFLDNVDVGGVTLKPEFQWLGLDYVLAILNSRLMRWYFPHISAPFRGGWRSANRQFLSKLPIKIPDRGDPRESALHRELVDRVAVMHELVVARELAVTEPQRQAAEARVAVVDDEIDALVHRLYGLQPREIALIDC